MKNQVKNFIQYIKDFSGFINESWKPAGSISKSLLRNGEIINSPSDIANILGVNINSSIVKKIIHESDWTGLPIDESRYIIVHIMEEDFPYSEDIKTTRRANEEVDGFIISHGFLLDGRKSLSERKVDNHLFIDAEFEWTRGDDRKFHRSPGETYSDRGKRFREATTKIPDNTALALRKNIHLLPVQAQAALDKELKKRGH